MTDSNRAAADQLHDVRERIRIQEDQEKELRAGFIDSTLPLEGDAHVVVIERKVNERIALRTMRQQVPVPESVWSPYVISTPTVYVRTEPKRQK